MIAQLLGSRTRTGAGGRGALAMINDREEWEMCEEREQGGWRKDKGAHLGTSVSNWEQGEQIECVIDMSYTSDSDVR